MDNVNTEMPTNIVLYLVETPLESKQKRRKNNRRKELRNEKYEKNIGRAMTENIDGKCEH